METQSSRDICAAWYVHFMIVTRLTIEIASYNSGQMRQSIDLKDQ